MTIGPIGAQSQFLVQNLLGMRRDLDTLQAQLGSGKKATNYAGLGTDANLATALRAQIAEMQSYDQTITVVGTRLNLTQSALGRMTEIRQSAAAAVIQSSSLTAASQNALQANSRAYLDEVLDLLNSRAGDRYLFGGRSINQPAVESTEHILDGDGPRAGLNQLISERAQADLGASGLGRLTSALSANAITIWEDVTGSPFGLKLDSITSSTGSIVTSGPSGSPAMVNVAFGTVSPGDQFTITFRLPDGTSEKVPFTATLASPPGPEEFTIGSNGAGSAANFQVALTNRAATLAQTSLKAASAALVAKQFFDIDVGQLPMRVAGPPFNTATALVAGTPANTLFWYTGEMATDAARGSIVAQVDPTISVEYGVRGNEPALANLVQNLALLASGTFVVPNPNALAGYTAMAERVRTGFANTDPQKLEDISSELASSQLSMKAAQDRHKETSSSLTGLLDSIEGISTEEVATRILTLQTRLQASLQTTAKLYQMNLTDYI
jgi:flagellar hook-associated protein 3 FlgL